MNKAVLFVLSLGLIAAGCHITVTQSLSRSPDSPLSPSNPEAAAKANLNSAPGMASKDEYSTTSEAQGGKDFGYDISIARRGVQNGTEEPPDASICRSVDLYFDGDFVGNNPAKLVVPPGEHLVVLGSRWGCRRSELQIVVSSPSPTHLFVD
jgi:hypothetical protein